jgi:hypothetical protein
MTTIKIYRLLFFLTIICMLVPSCRKQRAIENVIEQNLLTGDYQLTFFQGFTPGTNQDSIWLVNNGMMCNFTIENKGNIVCYYGDSHEFKAAEWKMTEAETDNNYTGLCRFSVRMGWPEKSKINFEYSICQDSGYYSAYYHATHIVSCLNFSSSAVFLNNINTPYGWSGAFYFRKNK